MSTPPQPVLMSMSIHEYAVSTPMNTVLSCTRMGCNTQYTVYTEVPLRLVMLCTYFGLNFRH